MNWTALVTSVIVAACGGRTGLGQGGVGAAAACTSEIIATDPQGATALALDGDDVFWGTTDGLVEKRDGSGISVLATEASTITAVAVDASRVYYTTTGVLHAVPRTNGAAVDIATQLGQPLALALDSSTGSFFLLDYGAGIMAGRVLRVDPSGTVTELMTGLDVPSGLAVDDAWVYVAAHGALLNGQTVDGSLLRMPKIPTPGGVGLLLGNLHSPSSVAVYGNDVYVIEQLDAQSTEHGQLLSLPETGPGVITSVLATTGVLLLDVFVDSSGAYVTTYSGTTNQNEGTLRRAALDGSGGPELSATPGVLYGAVRASPKAVYWTINWLTGQAPADRASVRKLCK